MENKIMENINLNEFLSNEEVAALEKFSQVIPADLMQEIKTAAKAKDISIELETLSRFLATFMEPQQFGLKSNIEKILKQNFSTNDAVAECKRNRQHWLYVYEVEKLRLFLAFENKIPRNFKEKFISIDVKAESKRILAELKKSQKPWGDAED